MRWFQAACVILALLGIVHSGSYLTSPPPPANATEKTLNELMSGYRTDMMGVQRSQGDLFTGFLISFSVLPLTIAAAGLALAPVVNQTALARLAAVNFIGLAVMTGVSIYWWFHAPTAFLLLSAICFGVSAWKLRN